MRSRIDVEVCGRGGDWRGRRFFLSITRAVLVVEGEKVSSTARERSGADARAAMLDVHLCQCEAGRVGQGKAGRRGVEFEAGSAGG